MNKSMSEAGIVVAMCICVTIGGCVQDSIFVDQCTKQEVYAPVTASGILIECYTVEHVDEKSD